MPTARTLAACSLFLLSGFALGKVTPWPCQSRDSKSPSDDSTHPPRGEVARDAERTPTAPPLRAEHEPASEPPRPALSVSPPAPPSVVRETEPAPAAPRPTRVSREALLGGFRFTGIGPHGGVRLARVVPGTLPDLLGLKTGDELITLNGFRLAQPEQVLMAYARLPYMDDWVARVHRGGELTEIRYAVR